MERYRGEAEQVIGTESQIMPPVEQRPMCPIRKCYLIKVKGKPHLGSSVKFD